MKKIKLIMAVMVLSGCLLAQGCTLVSKRTEGDVTKVGLFSMDRAKFEYYVSLYDGNVSDQTITLIRLYAD